MTQPQHALADKIGEQLRDRADWTNGGTRSNEDAEACLKRAAHAVLALVSRVEVGLRRRNTELEHALSEAHDKGVLRPNEQEGVDAALPEERSDDTLHLSSERRRGLEEAERVALAFAAEAAEELKTATMYTQQSCVNQHGSGICIAARIRALLSPSSEGGEEKTDG